MKHRSLSSFFHFFIAIIPVVEYNKRWKVHFSFFDYEEPLMRFLLDYVAVMGLFAFAGHYLANALKLCKVKKKSE